MDPHMPVIREEPINTAPCATPRPSSEADREGAAQPSDASSLLVRAWPETIDDQGAAAIEQWPGPLLLVPEAASLDEPPDLARLILASSDVERIEALAEWVAGTAPLADSHLYLLMAMEQDDVSDGGATDGGALRASYERAQGRLSALTASLRLLGLHANWEVRFGALGDEVVGLATTTGTAVVAVQRPACPGPRTDFARLASYLQRDAPHLSLLVGPTEPDAPVSGNCSC